MAPNMRGTWNQHSHIYRSPGHGQSAGGSGPAACGGQSCLQVMMRPLPPAWRLWLHTRWTEKCLGTPPAGTPQSTKYSNAHTYCRYFYTLASKVSGDTACSQHTVEREVQQRPQLLQVVSGAALQKVNEYTAAREVSGSTACGQHTVQCSDNSGEH